MLTKLCTKKIQLFSPSNPRAWLDFLISKVATLAAQSGEKEERGKSRAGGRSRGRGRGGGGGAGRREKKRER